MTGAEWIEGHADYLQKDCCLIWPFGRNSTGYGLVTIDGEQTYAHRAMCKRVHGEPPTPEHQAAHSCGRGHDGCLMNLLIEETRSDPLQRYDTGTVGVPQGYCRGSDRAGSR
jgi:hypothetical protein